jgi:hypothetical protein
VAELVAESRRFPIEHVFATFSREWAKP